MNEGDKEKRKKERGLNLCFDDDDDKSCGNDNATEVEGMMSLRSFLVSVPFISGERFVSFLNKQKEKKIKDNVSDVFVSTPT